MCYPIGTPLFDHLVPLKVSATLAGNCWNKRGGGGEASLIAGSRCFAERIGAAGASDMVYATA